MQYVRAQLNYTIQFQAALLSSSHQRFSNFIRQPKNITGRMVVDCMEIHIEIHHWMKKKNR